MLSKLQEKIILTHYLNSDTLLIKYELKHIFRQIRFWGLGRKKRAPKHVLLGEMEFSKIRRQTKTEATRKQLAHPGEGSKEALKNRWCRRGAKGQTSKEETGFNPGKEDLF